MKHSFGLILTLFLSSLLVACGGGGSSSDSTPFVATDVQGTWNVYRTYTGKPEQGPDLSTWSNSGTGYGIKMHLECSTYVLLNSYVDIAGEAHSNNISLNIGTSTVWEGTIDTAASTMSGTFSDSNGSGTWHAERTQSQKCATYEVYGGDTYLFCGGTQGYNPQQYGYTLIGSGTTTATFTAAYKYYVIVTRDFNVIHLDTVKGSDGTYFGTNSTGNITDYQNIGGSPDGLYAIVGANRMSGGGYVDIDASLNPLSSITVYIAP